MVCYSFQPRFVEPIRAKVKGGTIRAHRKRHARPGEQLQLYCRQRRPDGFKIIDDVTCLRVNEIEFDITDHRNPLLISNGVEIPAWSLQADQFARADGFGISSDQVREFHQMVAFWRCAHGAILFRGVHIIWQEAAETLIEVPVPCIKAPENA